jgi:hypothetical protein
MRKGAMNPYTMLAIMIALSFLSMYVLMYAMVNVFSNVFLSLNQLYMAGLMTAPMVVIEVVLMRAMYPNGTVNVAIIAASVVALMACWFLIRQQVAIGDAQFVRSMVPHHAGAILMCEKASLTDQDLVKLCKAIIARQQAEIDQMKARLTVLAK